MKTRKQAELLGKKVLSQLGEGWKVRVWENLGWNVCWLKGAVSLHFIEEDRRTSGAYWAMVGPVDSGVGHSDFGGAAESSNSPREAVKLAVESAMKTIVSEWQPIISSVSAILLEVMDS